MRRSNSIMEAYKDGYPMTHTFKNSVIGTDKEAVKRCVREVRTVAGKDNFTYVINPKSLVFCYPSAGYDISDPNSLNSKIARVVDSYFNTLKNNSNN